jgi:hypothetical protein
MGRYRVLVTTTVEITVADELLALSQDTAWVRDFYGLDTPELVAEHLAWNIGLNGRELSRLDGFADRDDADVRVQVVEVEYETEEMPS